MNDLTLSIPTPCHEKWEHFAGTPHGGFCFSCRKEVIDFTSWSEDQVKAYFKNPANYSACGRFKIDQLKTYVSKKNPATISVNWFSLPVLGLTMLLSSNHVKATGVKKISYGAVGKELSLAKTETTSTLTSKIIHGVVKDRYDSVLPGVYVVLKGTTITTSTDRRGEFTITIPNPHMSDVLVFSFLGYLSTEKNIAAEDEASIVMEEDMATLSGAVVVGGVYVRRRWTPGGIWWRIKNIFR